MKKTCTRCHVSKPFNEFPKNNQKVSGLDPRCKRCCAEMANARRLRDPDRDKEIQQRTYAKHRRKRLAERTAWREQLQEVTGTVAEQHKGYWGVEDLKTAMRSDISTEEVAVLLGRTYVSVVTARQRVNNGYYRVPGFGPSSEDMQTSA